MRRLPLLIGSLLPLLVQALPAQEVGPPPAGDPPTRAARISYLAGTVSAQSSGDTTWSLASVNYPLTTGDRLYADRGARGEIQVGTLTLRVSDATDLTVTSLTDQLVQIGLAQGTLRISVHELAPSDSVEIDTPRGALTLLAVGEYRIDAPPDESPMVVSVYRGTLQWTAGGVAQVVQGGQAITVSGINPIEVASTAAPGADAFDQWSAERDRQLASSASARYVSRDVPGYADLDAAGEWQTDVEYGPVWYPVGVEAGWAPYRHGHWVWIDPWGWNWVERESWGYAPFHYGRWVYVRSRWGWLPGSLVGRPYYAPALVVFVDGSGFDGGAQAWFPLGPGEPYHPWYHSGADYRRRMNDVTFGRVANIPATTSVTAINYRNRRLAFTAVPVTTFRSGLPISRRILTVDQDQIEKARIAPHPFVLPGASADGGGSARVPSPRVRRPTWSVAPAPRPTPTVQAHQPLIVRNNLPAPRMQPKEPPVAPGGQPAPSPSRVLITRRAPPPPEPSFQVRQQAMKPDAGRPLEPQQIDNIRAGRPAGPQRDSEYPPHQAAPAPRAAPRPAEAPRPVAAPRPVQEPRAAPAPRPAPAKPAENDNRRRDPGR